MLTFPSSSPCQRQLSGTKRAVKKFFTNFEDEHDIAHDDYLAVKAICDQLTAVLNQFSAPDFGCGQTDEEIECQIAEFTKAFYVMRLDAIEHLTHLRYYVDLLLNLADDFRCGNKLVCNADSTCSGCEAETNKLNCDLVEFFDGLTAAGPYVKGLLDSLLKSCDVLGQQVRDFDCANSPQCSGSGCGCGGGAQSNPDVIANFNCFLAPFVAEHDAAHVFLVDIGVVCDTLTASILSFL